MEGFELFGRDEDECKAGQSESENEEDWSIFDIDLLQDIPIEFEVQPEQRMIGKSVAVAGIIQNDEKNKDAIFLDRMQNLLDECETSILFIHSEITWRQFFTTHEEQ